MKFFEREIQRLRQARSVFHFVASYGLIATANKTSLVVCTELKSELSIVDCRAIMHSPPTRLYVDNTVQEAIDLLVEHHMYNLPVVDRDEIFVGEISTRRLIGLMLPVSLSMEMGLKHTGFMRETREELKKRLDKVSDQSIAPYIATDITVVYPDSPLIDALMLLYHKFIRIAVVERDNRRLVGGISFLTVLRALEEKD